MVCPSCNQKLKKAVFHQTAVDYCSKCLGIWFGKDELRQAKDDKDDDLKWLDIDLWQNEKKFKISQDKAVCPACSVPLYSIDYGDSKIKVKVCSLCEGVWLDRGEFRKIIEYLKEKGKEKALKDYFGVFLEEWLEVFTGPEELKSELADFWAVVKVLNYKLMVQYPLIAKIIMGLAKQTH